MRYIISISPEMDERIRKLIAKAGYHDFNHFANVALENHIVTEQESYKTSTIENKSKSTTIEPSPITSKVDRDISQIPDLLEIQKGDFRTLPYPNEDNLVLGPLWGQYYKFLPIKVGLRVLANLNLENFPLVDKYKEITTDVAERFLWHLQDIDRRQARKFGDKLSTSFPKGDKKSRKRFMDQYLIYVRPTDGRLDGMLPRLKMVNIKKAGNSFCIGITQAGLEFSMIENPIIDNQKTSSTLSKKEVDYLLKYIYENLKDEANQISAILAPINDGITSRVGLNKFMRDYYRKSQKTGGLWTDAKVDTMRAGLISRLSELGLVSKTKKGVAVIYNLTEEGYNLLEKVRTTKEV